MANPESISSKRPLVSMVVPVYNGADYLEACLQSIENQTYENWHAVVVNNCSTDGSGAIADGFAARDPRIRVEHCTEFLPQADNYNRALSLASPEAVFVKIVEADNVLWPECIERQVAVAELDEETGIVGSFYLFGEQLHGAGFPAFRNVISGEEVAIMHLRSEAYLFGTPTTLLFRHQALRSITPVFQPDLLHDDVDLCIRLLKRWKFGFDHQVLAFVRTENGSFLPKHIYFDCMHTQLFHLIKAHGGDFFDEAMLEILLRAARTQYYRAMGRAVLTRKNSDYWKFHAKMLHRSGEELLWWRVCSSAVAEFVKLALNPLATLETLARRRSGQISSLSSRLGLPHASSGLTESTEAKSPEAKKPA